MKDVKKYNYFVSFYIFFIIILIYQFLNQIIVACQKPVFMIPEWLINYQGGFVRRGLWGEIFLNIYYYFGINPYILIILFSSILFIVFLIFFIKLYIKRGLPLFVLPFVFFLGNPIINDFWLKKDILLVIIFSLILYFSNKKTITKLIFVNIFFILGILTHEAIAFFGVPIIFLIFYNKNSLELYCCRLKSVILSFFQLLPTILIFIFSLYFKGSVFISNAIWDSWKTIKFSLEKEDLFVMPTTIEALSWSLKKGLEHFNNFLHYFNYGVYAPVAWLLIIVIIYYLLINLDNVNLKIINYKKNIKLNKLDISVVLFFQLLSITPLFILGWDFSRWIFFWVVSSFLIIFLIPGEKLLNLFPRIFLKLCANFNNFLLLKFSKFEKLPLFLVFFIGIPFVSTFLHQFLTTTPFGFIFKTILPPFIVSLIKTIII